MGWGFNPRMLSRLVWLFPLLLTPAAAVGIDVIGLAPLDHEGESADHVPWTVHRVSTEALALSGVSGVGALLEAELPGVHLAPARASSLAAEGPVTLIAASDAVWFRIRTSKPKAVGGSNGVLLLGLGE